MIATYAFKQGWKRDYIAVADYGPGYDMKAIYKQHVESNHSDVRFGFNAVRMARSYRWCQGVLRSV
jgi:hypothetical protein